MATAEPFRSKAAAGKPSSPVRGYSLTPSGRNCKTPVWSDFKEQHMKQLIENSLLLGLAAATLFITTPNAMASEDIVKKARCVACHTVDQKRVGPPYKEVAAKYKGDSKAPMMPEGADKISGEDLKGAVAWMLGRHEAAALGAGCGQGGKVREMAAS